jgi:hypothetical protein
MKPTLYKAYKHSSAMYVVAHVPRMVGTLPEVFRLKSPPPPAPDDIFADTVDERLCGGFFPPGRYPDKTAV